MNSGFLIPAYLTQGGIVPILGFVELVDHFLGARREGGRFGVMYIAHIDAFFNTNKGPPQGTFL